MKFDRIRLITGERQEAGQTGVRIGWPAVVTGVLLAVLQGGVTLYATHRQVLYLTGTQIPVLSFLFLFILVLLANPLLARLPKLRPLGRAELMAIFAAMFVTAGLSTFGLVDHLIPLISTPWNPKWNTPQAGWNLQINPNLDSRLFITDPRVVLQFREGLSPNESLLRDVPWGAWLGPVLRWLLLGGLVYAMFYFLSFLVYRQWSRREQLTFPLVKIPEAMLPPDDHGRVPDILKTALFWAGFTGAFGVLFWNGAVQAGWIHGLGPIPLTLNAGRLFPGTVLEGIVGVFRLRLLFIALGIAFLLPTDVSFSVWFYFLVRCGMVALAYSLGYGRSFPCDRGCFSNFVTAQGGGAILAFGAFCLVKTLDNYRREYSTLPAGQRAAALRPVLGLVGTLAAMTLWMATYCGDANPVTAAVWAFAFVTGTALITTSFMRIVAECGIYGLQCYGGPIHLARITNAVRIIPVKVLLPLLTFHFMFFYDLKAFSAPGVAGSLRMQETVRAPRFRFHLTVILAILFTSLVTVIVALCMAYRSGAQQMNPWFYSRNTRILMDIARRLVDDRLEWRPPHLVFLVLGMAWVATSFFLRRFLFWFPHPVGYVLLVDNFMVNFYWFGFFLAWAVKKVILRYGGKHTFDKTRPLFIGFIIGHISAAALWILLRWWFSLPRVYITLCD